MKCFFCNFDLYKNNKSTLSEINEHLSIHDRQDLQIRAQPIKISEILKGEKKGHSLFCCQQTFQTFNAYRVHILYHGDSRQLTDRVFACTHCHVYFKRGDEYFNHLSAVHGDIDNINMQKYHCDVCFETFTNLIFYKYSLHMNTLCNKTRIVSNHNDSPSHLFQQRPASVGHPHVSTHDHPRSARDHQPSQSSTRNKKNNSTSSLSALSPKERSDQHTVNSDPKKIKQEPIEDRYNNNNQFKLPKTPWYQFKKRDSLLIFMVDIRDNQKTLFRKNIQEALKAWCSVDSQNKELLPKINKKYQTDVQKMMRVENIPEDDPRVGLRGQYGIFATQRIEVGTVLGIYVGQLYKSELFTPPKEYELPNAYLLSLQGHCYEVEYNIIVDAQNQGNWAALINAYTTYEKSEPQSEQNCCFMRVHFYGFPMVIVVAIEPIERDKELLIDYSERYWTEQRDDQAAYKAIGITGKPIFIE